MMSVALTSLIDLMATNVAILYSRCLLFSRFLRRDRMELHDFFLLILLLSPGLLLSVLVMAGMSAGG